MYEIRGMRGGSVGAVAIGTLLVLCGIIVYADKGVTPVAGSVLIVLGGAMVALALRGLATRAAQLRATAAGVSFWGGTTIPWTEIKQIHIGGHFGSAGSFTGKTGRIAIDFHHKLTIFRLPIGFWLLWPLAIGDADVSPHASADSAIVIAAKLEAMRVLAVGAEDGITVGESELPAARVVERDR